MSKSTRRSKRGNKSKNSQAFLDDISTDIANTNDASSDAKKCLSSGQIFSIEKSEALGRFMVSSRNINAGEMIIDGEPALVIGPIQQSDPVCLGCYVLLEHTNYRCKKCNWPLCFSSCIGLYSKFGHMKEECDILTDIPFDDELQFDKTNLYNYIVPLRCLLLKKHLKPEWKTLIEMESHNTIRKEIPSIWQLNEKTVVQKLSKYFDPRDIHTICGILEVNCFEVTRTDVSLRALYPTAALMSHNCVPNTIHTNDDEFKLRVRASVPISKGKPIVISYAYTLQGTAKRRAHIKETKFFDCNCDRCSDSSELGTNLSTIVCPKCNNPTLKSTSPLNENSTWMCCYKKCTKYTVSQAYIDDLTEKFENKLKYLPESDIESHEDWIKEASIIFHKNHYLISGVKYTLSLLYGKTQGYMLQDMTDDLLKRKILICEELLGITNIIEPGLSRMRGILLYELHAPIMMLLMHRNHSRSTTKKQLKHSLQRIVSCLKESSDILQFEGPNTMEGQIVKAAKEALVSTSEWEKQLEKSG